MTTRDQPGVAIELARKLGSAVQGRAHRVVVREVAAVAADDVHHHPGIDRALQFDLLQPGRVQIVTRGFERPEAISVSLWLRLQTVLPDADEAIVLRELPRHLPVVLCQQRVVIVGDRLIAGEIATVGARPRHEAQDRAIPMLPAEPTIEPQFVADDPAAQIGGGEVVVVQGLRIADPLRPQLRSQVVTLRLLALIRPFVLAVELVATGLEDGNHVEPRRAHLGAGARRYCLDLFHAGVVEIHRRIRVRASRDVDPLDLNLGGCRYSVGRHPGTLGHLAAAYVGRPLARNPGGHLDDRLHVAATRDRLENLAGERGFRGSGCQIYHRTLTADRHRLLNPANAQLRIDSGSEADRDAQFITDVRAEPGSTKASR